MSKAQFLLGRPVQFTHKITIYPPLIKDIVDDSCFWVYMKMLTQSQEDIQDELAKVEGLTQFPTPLEYLLANCKNNEKYADLVKQGFKFFLHQEVEFLYDIKRIVCGKLQEIIDKKQVFDEDLYITESNFFDFQNLIREACGRAIVEKPDPNEHPKIARMKAKARLRDKIKQKQTGKNGLSFERSLVLICCMGVGVNPLNIGEISYPMFGELLSSYQVKEQYELDVRALLAGGDSKKIHPVYWIK